MMASIPLAEMSQELLTKTEFKVKGLPPGWRREVVIRKNGQSAGKTDVYYYSPCGKKFRSKPQIARFLGDAADLTVFDFSRAGTPGDGSSRRRARDRSARRVEVARQGPPPVRPLTINPLRPSGPIRRTCGVIKLPVTWVPAPCEDELKLKLCALMKLQEEASMDVDQPQPQPMLNPVPPVALPAAPLMAANGGEVVAPKPVVEQQPQPPVQPQAQPPAQPPVPPLPTTVIMVPALWENRLKGVMAYDYETGNEIKITPEKLHNGLNHSSNGEGKEGHLSLDKSTLSALLNQQLVAKIEDKKHLASSVSAGSVIPSLLAHGKNVPRHQQGILTTMVPSSLKTIKENGSLIATPQQNSGLGGNIVLTLPSMASANSYKSTAAKPGSIVLGAPAQPRNIRASIMPGRAVTTNKPGPSSVSQAGGLYVSESELRRQEEKVQLIRKQLLAAQSSV